MMAEMLGEHLQAPAVSHAGWVGGWGGQGLATTQGVRLIFEMIRLWRSGLVSESGSSVEICDIRGNQ